MSLFRIIAVLGSSGEISGTVGTLINAVSIDDYGAVGDGTTDDTEALIAAVATGFNVFIPKNKNYRIIGTNGGGVTGKFAVVKLGVGQMVVGEDRYTSKITVTGNGRGIQLAKNSAVANLTMKGAGIGSGLGFNAGLAPFGIGWTVDNCDFTDFSGNDSSNGGGGIFAIGDASITNFKDGGNIFNSDFYANVTGLNYLDRAEYMNTSNCKFMRNTTGIVNYAGNNKFIGLNIIENGTGFKLRTGANDGHGMMSACTVNHNTTNLDIDGIVVGFKFSGTMFYQGSIAIANSTRIAFSGCDLVGGAGLNLTLTNNASIKVGAECYFPTSGSDALNKTLVSGTDIAVV